MIGPERLGARVGPEAFLLDVGDQEHLLEQIVQVGRLLGGDVGELRRPAPLLGLQPLGGELRAHPVRVGLGRVDLVDGDHDRHLGGARVGDRLLRLRHDAVVRRDDEDGDVGHLRAARAHGGERLVARRVEERDLTAVVLHLVGADVLRDPAGLGLDDGGLANRVEQRRLAVVDVAHDRDDGRPGNEVLLGVVEVLGLDVLLRGVLDVHLAPDLGRDELDRLVRERLGDGDHLPQSHHDLDDLGDRNAESGRQLLDRGARGNLDGTGRLDDFLRRRLGPRLLLIACLT